METEKRVYRAVAHYADGSSIRRDFLTKRSRDRWAQNRRDGYPEQPGYVWDVWEDEGLAAIPPAVRVDVQDSDPLVFN